MHQVIHRTVEAEQPSRKRDRSPLSQSREILPRVGRAKHSNRVDKEGHRKASAACETCRVKKVKCNEGWPLCSYCSRHGFKCDYPNQRQLRYVLVTDAKNSIDGNSHEKPFALLLERLVQAESRLNQLEHSSRISGSRGTPSVSECSGREDSSSPLQVWTGQAQAPASLLPGFSTVPAGRPVDISVITNKTCYPSPEFPTKEYYLGKTPLACEEERAPFRDVALHEPEPSAVDVISAVQSFQDHAGVLYPLLCDSTLSKLSNAVNARGFGDDQQSCLMLLIIAITKAYESKARVESGLPEFERAMQLRIRLSARLSLEYVQILGFSALFLLKRGRLLDFSVALHSCSTLLCTLIGRDQSSGIDRPRNETNMIRSLFWVCRDFERDIIHEIGDMLPQSRLYDFEELFSLPLPCEEPTNKNMPIRVRNLYTFFLADTSLRAILERILTTSGLVTCVQGFPTQTGCGGSITLSPIIQELRQQLDTWVLRLPPDFDWSVEPGCGNLAPVGTRLKLLYWFARFSILRPTILQLLSDSSLEPRLLQWEPFREGLQPALTMVKVYLVELPDVDVLMANRLVTVLALLKKIASAIPDAIFNGDNLERIEQLGADLLLSNMHNYSEWITCKLTNI